MAEMDMLKDMGFEEQRAKLALKHGGDLQGAVDWLDRNQEKTTEELEAEEAESNVNTSSNLNEGDVAKSLVCNECGKKFRGQAEAEFHASKSGHVDFAQSTEEIAPLTEEEKKTKLAELREKMAAKKATQSAQDKVDQKRNEEIRRKATKESQDVKEDLQRKEKIKEAEKKKQEKLADIEAKKRIQAKIAADKEERRLKAEREKAARSGQPIPQIATETAAAQPSAPPAKKAATSYTEARLRLQTPNGTIQKTFPADTTLFEVAHALAADNGTQVETFTATFPKKVFDQSDFGQTLREAGWVPSAALIVKSS